ncbi:hypothetical protein JL_126 [Bacillus phage JL]|uniref:Uncharacterized protein n=1 Tax=Bacillus phage JL TaxID=1296655 RepID=S5MAJ9_9CAUD|nr:hypothetical protein AVV47_gp170 [Bacillus phage JL]AGR46799.1 hypothetical protein JL_126 [Bacillus phage JL]
MNMVRIELNEVRKWSIKRFVETWSNVEDLPAEDWGIKAGLNWVLRKLQMEVFIWEPGEIVIDVPMSIIKECKKEWREHAINAHWNLGYSRAILSVFTVLGLDVRAEDKEEEEEPIEYITNYYNK